MKNIILISIFFFFINCRQSREEYLVELEKDKINYETSISLDHKNLVNKIFENQQFLEISDVIHKKNILVLHERKGEIIPYSEINNKLKEKGYSIEFNSNNVDYIICVKSIGINVGQYSDGSNAWDTKTDIIVLDTKNNNNICLIASDYKETPESVRKYRNAEPGNYGSRGIEGDELVELILNKL